MTTVGIADLKASLSKYVSKAAGGESFIVTDRDSPVAMLVPLSPELRAFERLRREGILRGKLGYKPKGVPIRPGQRLRRKNTVSDAVVEMREDREDI